MKHSVYILECADKSLYVGCTNNLEKRLKQHNESKRGAHYTKIRRPVILKYSEEFPTLGKARTREAALKRLPRNKKLTLIILSSNKNMFFETKIDRFEVDKEIDPSKVKEDFDLIDNYKNKVLEYIFTEIKIGPEVDFETALQGRVQMFLSQSLLRSLFLKDEIVHSLNSNNFPAFYAITKSFIEIPAQLGYLTYVLYEDKPNEELQEALRKLVFGHKGGLSEIKGAEPINVMTMLDKLDVVLQKIGLSEATNAEKIKQIKAEKAMRTFYDDICNFGHPNFAAHLSIGKINKEGYWVAKDPKKLESYKYELYAGFYMHHFTTAIATIYITASMITRHPKVNFFKKLSNPHLNI